MPDELLFGVPTTLGFSVRIRRQRWQLIVRHKHPVMVGLNRDVAETLRVPDEVRCSRSDADVYLFYRRERPNRWICVVVKRLDGDGFVITTYPTAAIK